MWMNFIHQNWRECIQGAILKEEESAESTELETAENEQD